MGFDSLVKQAKETYCIDPTLYEKYNVKRGLRNKDGTGVLVGLTGVGEVRGYMIEENDRVPVQGRLCYRGMNVEDIVRANAAIGEHAFEEVIYLILLGQLPSPQQEKEFNKVLADCRNLPNGFAEDMILKAPSPDIMNKLARSVLALYSYDNNADDTSIENVLRQSIELIARFPALIAYGYQAKKHYYDHDSLYLHAPQKDLDTAENVLYMIRRDNKFTDLEADVLDLMLVLHAEHGGGNNSAFATHVVSSSGTDAYSAIAAAVGSLKGPKHGGANMRVMGMISDIKNNCNWKDEDSLKDYLVKILKKQGYDNSGLIYGMGHAVYTLSDPRAMLLKEKAAELAEATNMLDDLTLYQRIERLTPGLFAEVRGNSKIMCANIDLYSGFVYQMLNISPELYTPFFAVSRIAGWCAHLIEEISTGGRIIRPAYKSVCKKREYINKVDRTE